MTVIVWDGDTLATDRIAASRYTKRKVRKAWYRNTPEGKIIISGAGYTDEINAMEHWYMGGMKEKIDRDVFKESTLIIVRGGNLVYYDDPFKHNFVGKKSVAFGSGAPWAFGALEMGATAVEAAKIACLHCIRCGGGIDTYTLKGGKRGDHTD